MKNKMELVGESFNNIGKDLVRLLFELQDDFLLKEDFIRFVLKKYIYDMLREKISLEGAKGNLLEIIYEVVEEVEEEKESEQNA